MKGRLNIYHLCNISSKVIFRNEEDYLIAICRLAACAYATSTDVWAYAFMSTHFHLIVKSDNLSNFISLFKTNIAKWHNRKYLNNIQIDIGKRELLNEWEIKIAVNYVLKNPIHHKIADTVFRYPYSSAHIYYNEKISTAEYFEGERSVIHYQKPSELAKRIYKKLFASHQIPDNYLVLKERVIIPDSFVKINIIESLYANVREFMFHMNKPLKEELEMFGESESGNNAYGLSDSRVSLFGKLTDIQVCKIVDEYIYPKTYTQITLEERAHLYSLLKQRGVEKFQFERIV